MGTAVICSESDKKKNGLHKCPLVMAANKNFSFPFPCQVVVFLISILEIAETHLSEPALHFQEPVCNVNNKTLPFNRP